MLFVGIKANYVSYWIVCQISINDINVCGKVSSSPLAGEDTCFTSMDYEATCWLDSVASEVFKIKVRFVWGLFFLFVNVSS